MSAEKRVELSELRRAADAHDGEIVTGLDRFGRIVDQYWIDGMSTATDRFQYGYDENSNRLFRRNVVDATFSELYAYDNFDQLSDFARGTLSTTSDSIVGTPVRSQDWSPHPLGNAATISTSISGTPTPEGRTYNAQNQFDTVGGNSLSYDNNGNLIVDQNGNLYFYDAWNRFVKVEDSSNNLLTAYNYNPLNHRIIEDDGTTETHLFYSANWQVLEEQASGDTITQYVWSPVYIDAMILRDRDANSSSGDGLEERLYVQQDANWNVTALVDASTGDVVQRFVQDPFGLVTDILDDSWSPQADAYDWKYLHQGLRLDMAVGMNLYDGRNRIYDPVLQRWLQVDPSGFNAGDSNLYRYVDNGPVNRIDPLGMQGRPHGGHRPKPRRSIAQTFQHVIRPVLKAELKGQTVYGEKRDKKPFTEAESFTYDLIPVVGQVKGLIEMWLGTDYAGNDLGTSDYAIGAAGFLPFGKVVDKGIKYGGKTIGAIEKQSVKRVTKTITSAPTALNPLTREARDALRTSARDIWQARTGRRAIWDGMDVHHRIPLEWSHLFPNSNPNRVSNLIGMTPANHTQVTNAWNAWRQGLNGRILTQAEVVQQAIRIDEQFANMMRFLP